MGKRLRLLGALLFCSTLALTGCGGGSDSPPPKDSNLTSINSGVAVDPYIIGGLFQEIDANGTVIQETLTPSDSSGNFDFPNLLHIGNTISLKAGTGTHGGVPFQGTLKRTIEASSGPMVLNPLTTLIANGVAPADVLALLNAITPGVVFTLADLTADPMDRLSDGTMTDADKALLAANMAVNTAGEVLGGNIGSLANLTTVANVVAVKLTNEVMNTLTESSTVAALNVAASTGVSVTNYLVKTVTVAGDGSTNVEGVTNSITPTYIDDIAALVLDDPTKPVVIDNPTEAPLQVSDTNALAQIYYAAGQKAYTDGSATGSTAKLMAAIDKFNAAAALKDSITDPALKDKVLFFGAFAKVLQVAKPMSDGTTNGLNNFGDILDAFGLAGSVAATDRTNINTLDLSTCTTQGTAPYTWQECDLVLHQDSPTSGDLQTMLYNKIGAGLTDAVAMLGQVSSTFNTTVNDGGTTVEFDATDAKFIAAVANGMLAQINLLQAYDVNVDIDAETNRTAEQTPEQFLAANPNLGKLKDATRVAAVKTYANAAITALESAIAALQAETDDQANDFVKFDNTHCYWTNNYSSYVCDPTTYNDTTEFEATLAEAKKAINATTYNVMDNGPDGISGNSDDTVAAVINVSKFFAGVDLRSKLPSTFNNGASGDMPGLFPDPTFGGALIQIDGQAPAILNTDQDKDGSPDIFGTPAPENVLPLLSDFAGTYTRSFDLGDSSRESYVISGDSIEGTRHRWVNTSEISMTISGTVEPPNSSTNTNFNGHGTVTYINGTLEETRQFNFTGSVDLTGRLWWTSDAPNPGLYPFGGTDGLACKDTDQCF